jgi:hypothetical protein
MIPLGPMRAASDLHLSPISRPWVLEVLAQLREDTLEHGGPTVLVGDLLDVAEVVHGESLVEMYRALQGWPGELWIVPGNHDYPNRNLYSSPLELFHGGPVHVVKMPSWTPVGLMIPFQRPSDFWFKVKAALRNQKPDHPNVWWSHQGWNGAYMNTMRRDTRGLSQANISADLVVSGHYHLPHGVGKVVYCGSPYETTFACEGQTKGFLRWDGTTLYPERVPFVTSAPKHVSITWDPAEGPPEIPTLRPQDIPRIITTASREVARAASDQLKKAGLGSVPVITSAASSAAVRVAASEPWEAVEAHLIERHGQGGPDPMAVREYAEEADLWMQTP